MIFVILGIGILTVIIGIAVYNREYETENAGILTLVFGIAVTLLSLISLFAIAGEYVKAGYIEEKKQVYEEDRQLVVEGLKNAIDENFDKEDPAYQRLVVLDGEALINAVAVWADVTKSDAYKSQIEDYRKCSDEIDTLKIEQIESKIYGWWLFFKK